MMGLLRFLPRKRHCHLKEVEKVCNWSMNRVGFGMDQTSNNHFASASSA